MKYEIDTQKTHNRKLFLASDTFISNTGWDLIQNNKHLRYQKDQKENQYCTEPPAFKSQIFLVEYQSNQILLQFYQHEKKSAQFINSILRYNRF